MKKTKQILAAAALVVGFGLAHAGPIIIAGTDADDHGFFNTGANQTGWKFMQLGMTNIGGAVSNGQNSAVCLGQPGIDPLFNVAIAATGLHGGAGSRDGIAASPEFDERCSHSVSMCRAPACGMHSRRHRIKACY